MSHELRIFFFLGYIHWQAAYGHIPVTFMHSLLNELTLSGVMENPIFISWAQQQHFCFRRDEERTTL